MARERGMNSSNCNNNKNSSRKKQESKINIKQKKYIACQQERGAAEGRRERQTTANFCTNSKPSKRSAQRFKRVTGAGKQAATDCRHSECSCYCCLRYSSNSNSSRAIRAPLAAALNGETTVDLSTCICCTSLPLAPLPSSAHALDPTVSCLTPVAGYTVSGKLRLSAK